MIYASINQSTNQSINQSISQSGNQSIRNQQHVDVTCMTQKIMTAILLGFGSNEVQTGISHDSLVTLMKIHH